MHLQALTRMNTVCLFLSGLEWHNPDIKENYSPEGSWDLNSDDPDPTPHPDKGNNFSTTAFDKWYTCVQ